jgi:uncharacterized circularly permuted ATP-grasp superfamily protein/uncharacterized alpha-E superfamily protein
VIHDLLQLSLPGPPVYDELSADGINPRPHWEPFIQSLQSVGMEELARRWGRAERRIRENGITYNIYNDPQGANRPWGIDAIPLLIPAEEWRRLEAGIIQRAQLLNLLLEQLYGSRKLILNGDLPAELLFANPAFLRPLASLSVPKQSYLHLLAVDLARSPNGQWWVLADRTQAPSGAGYALENRTIVSDVLPDLFRSSNVRRLAGFFRAQRDALIDMAGSDDPQIVLLTPGPYNETYFEHAYLARYMGFTLVEGADLTVRDRRVYLKTVEGLRRIHVILRRVDDSFCDPLELRGDSFLGVAGLVDAISAGNVKVANALGSGVVETAAIMPFLPGLSWQLLGEPLKLPSVATWWCGQDYALDWVLQNLDKVVVKPAFPLRGMEPVFGAELAKAEKEKLAARLRARPYEYVAQEQVALSTAPVWDKGHLYSRSLVLRTYVLNTGSGWLAMPGGLVRVAGAEGPVVSMQQGGHSKDAWVLWDSPVDTFSMLRPRYQPVDLRSRTTDLPSRVADNLFWLGRYVERAECKARLLRCMLTRVRRASEAELACLLQLHGCLETKHSKFPKGRPPTAADLEKEIISFMADEKRPDSLLSTLGDVYRVGGNVRERLSMDMTRLVGQLAGAARVEEGTPFVEYSAVATACLELLSAFSGMERENITRGPGWLFMSLGRRLERAMYGVRQLMELAGPIDEDTWPVLEYLLEVADSSMTYRARYFTSLQPAPVLDILMMDETNPRSLAFQLIHLADLYGKLPRHVPRDLRAIQRAMEVLKKVNLRDLHYPLPGAEPGLAKDGRPQLERTLTDLDNLLPSWSNNVSNTYFSHARTFAITVGDDLPNRS